MMTSDELGFLPQSGFVQQKEQSHAGHGRTPIWSYKEPMELPQVRYKGLSKNAVQVFYLVALANVYLAKQDLLQLRA